MNKREDDTMDIEEVIRRLKNMNEDGHLIRGDDIAIEKAISALERLRLYETNMKIIAEMMQNSSAGGCCSYGERKEDE